MDKKQTGLKSLQTDPEKRITRENTLQQPFIIMAHLVGEMEPAVYVTVCPV